MPSLSIVQQPTAKEPRASRRAVRLTESTLRELSRSISGEVRWDALTRGFESAAGFARIEAAEGVSAIHDLSGGRDGVAQPLPPNASLTRPYAAVPGLRGRLEPGRHELACAVFGSERRSHPEAQRPPGVPAAARALLDARAC